MLKGGKTPSLCDKKYTSYNTAEVDLIKYLKSTDRLGYAIYPNKGE